MTMCIAAWACVPPVPPPIPGMPSVSSVSLSPDGRYLAFVQERRWVDPDSVSAARVGVFDLAAGRLTSFPSTRWPVPYPADSGGQPRGSVLDASLIKGCWAEAPVRCAFTARQEAVSRPMELTILPGGKVRLDLATAAAVAGVARGCSDCAANPGADDSARTSAGVTYAAASSGSNATILARRALTGEVREVARFARPWSRCFAESLRLDPPGLRLAFEVTCGLGGTWFSQVKDIYVLTLATGALRRLAGAAAGPLTWRPDGSAFAVLVRDEKTRDLRVAWVAAPPSR